MSPKPETVTAAEDYLLLVKFDNGEEKVFDMKPFLHYPAYEELKDKSLFEEAKVQYELWCGMKKQT